MKKTLSYIFSLLLLTLFTLLLSSAISTSSVSAAPKLNKTTLHMSTADTAKLKVLNSDKKVAWSSSNKNVAKFDKNGKVTPVWFGSATISAKVGGKTLKCKVKILQEDYWRSDSSDFAITIMPISDTKARVRILVENNGTSVSSGDLIGKYDDGRLFINQAGKYDISAGISIVEEDDGIYCAFVVTDAAKDIFITDGTILDIKEENS